MKYIDKLKYEQGYGLFKNKIPTTKEGIAALELPGEATLLKKIFTKDVPEFYKEISINPSSKNQWLMSHKEFGETYKEFVNKKNYYPLLDNKNEIMLVDLNFKIREEKEEEEKKIEEPMPQNNREEFLSFNMSEEPQNNDKTNVKKPEEGERAVPNNQPNEVNVPKEESDKKDPPLDIHNIKTGTDSYIFLEKSKLPMHVLKEMKIPTDDLIKEFKPKLKQLLINYYPGIKITYSSEELYINDLVYKRNEDENSLVGIEADFLLEYLSKKISKKVRRTKYCYIFYTNFPLYHDLEIYRNNKANKYQYYPKSFMNNDKCYEMSNIKKRMSLISFSEFSFNNKQSEFLNQVYMKRGFKLVIRNIAAMLGIPNCIFFKCIMNGFESVQEFDQTPIELCIVCLRKVHALITKRGEEIAYGKPIGNPMMIYNRFVALKVFFEELAHVQENKKDEEKQEQKENTVFKGEYIWYKKRIESLKIFNFESN